jgi:uncharacterized repeat protein (TIGR03803 family)
MRSNRDIPGLIVAVVVFVTTTLAAGQTETVLHSFNYNGKDGTAPKAALIADSSGNLYGTTESGGAYNYGTVFELSPRAGGGWTEKLLHSFRNNGTDGELPKGGLIFDSAGNLYGTTSSGGQHLYGTVFELTPTSGGGWTEKVLHSFYTDGWFPKSGLILDQFGNLYGTTPSGGAYEDGEVFELTPGAGGTWTEKTLHSFFGDNTDGSVPFGAVLLDASGNLYGTTYQGGTYGTGTAFELAPGGGVNWTETVLFSFNNGNDGSADANSLYAGLIWDSAGNLYGTGYNGGAYNYGAVFELTPEAGGGWSQKILHSFDDNGTDGANPEGGLIFDTAGNLYGTTYNGGAYGYGCAFELGPKAGGGWSERILHSFNNNGTDGFNPDAGLVFGSGGNLYGTTGGGGAYGYGAVFAIRP